MPSQRVFLHVLAALLGCIYALASSYRYSCALISVPITDKISIYPSCPRNTPLHSPSGIQQGPRQGNTRNYRSRCSYTLPLRHESKMYQYSCASASVPIAGIHSAYLSPPPYTPSPLAFRSTRRPEARGRAAISQRVPPAMK